jgi:hypothetical protein
VNRDRPLNWRQTQLRRTRNTVRPTLSIAATTIIMLMPSRTVPVFHHISLTHHSGVVSAFAPPWVVLSDFELLDNLSRRGRFW